MEGQTQMRKSTNPRNNQPTTAKKRGFSGRTRIILIAAPILLACIAVAVVLILRIRRDQAPDQITITYANWNLGPNHDNALELRMLQSFMDDNPHINVVVDTSVTLPWMDGLAAAATNARLPDVFMVDDLGATAANGWLMDLTSIAWTDADFFDLSPHIRETVLINHAVYALPFAKDIHGYFINRDLFRALGVDVPSFGISPEGFFDAVRQTTNFAHPSIGINSTFAFVDWYPGAANPHLGFFAFDGLSFALNSPEMLNAIRNAADIYHGGYAFLNLDETTRSSYFPIGYDLGAFRNGQMAFFYGGSWLMGFMLTQVDFDWDFIGVPGGRSIVAMEIIGVYANTDHPEEAYKLAQWMGHSTEGNLRRLQYAQEMGITPNVLPASQNSQVLGTLWQTIPAQGFAQVYGAMDRALIDGRRVLPGYMQARYSAPTGVTIEGTAHINAGIDPLINYSITGDINFEDHSQMAEDIARQQLEAAQERLVR